MIDKNNSPQANRKSISNNLINNSAFSQSISQASSEKSIDNKFHKKFKSLSLKKIKKKELIEKPKKAESNKSSESQEVKTEFTNKNGRRIRKNIN